MSESELVLLVLGISVGGLVVAYRQDLSVIPHVRWVAAAFFCLVGAYAFTNIEEIVFPVALNFVEHTLSTVSSFLFLTWIVKVSGRTHKTNAHRRD
jgi:hypothetical protein